MKFNSLKDVQDTAEALMETHALLNEDWGFQFDNAVKRFGCCKHRKNSISKITLSRKLVQLNLDYNPEKIYDVILHEIAHALVRIKFGRFDTYGYKIKSHGEEWRAMCIQIGASPERCYSANEVETIQGKHKYVCKGCGREVFTHRKKRSKSACGDCCRVYNNNKFSLDYLLEYKGTA